MCTGTSATPIASTTSVRTPTDTRRATTGSVSRSGHRGAAIERPHRWQHGGVADDQHDDSPPRIVGFVRTITDENELQAALARLADRLPKDVAERLRADLRDNKPSSEIFDTWLGRELGRARVRRRMRHAPDSS
jgi:hypothetical protein